MRRRLLAYLLVAAMVISFAPTVRVSAQDTHDNGHVCPDDSCQGESITWQPWTGTEKNGHYYLTGDIKLSATVSLTGSNSLHLCLNGHKISGQDQYRLFALAAGTKLTVSDCTAVLDENGKLLSGGGLVDGYHASVGGAGIYNNGGTVVLSRISMSGHNCGCTSADGWAGSAIHVRGTGTVTVKNCYFTDNAGLEGAAISMRQDATVTVSDTVFHKNTVTGNGGAILVSAGNSTASKGAKLTVTNSIFTENQAAKGGAFYTSKTDAQKAVPELVFTGCSFRGNSAASGGGAAFATNAKVLLEGCTVTENKNSGNGGNALHIASNTVFTLKDSTVTGNLTTNSTGEAWKGALCQDNAASRFVLSGKVVIDDNYVKNGEIERNVLLQFVNSKLGVDSLAAGSKVSILTKNWNDGKDFEYATVSELLDISAQTDISTWQHEWVYYEDNESFVAYDELSGKLFFTGTPVHDHCLCGDGQEANCDHSNVIWQPWSKTDALPTDSGSYYLVSDITLTQNANLSTNDDIRICLNGKTVKVDYATEGAVQDQIYYMTRNGKLTISDCTAKTEDGVYTAGKLTGGSKAVISLNKLNDKATENTLVLYDGILTGNTNTTDGGAVNMTAGSGTFLMYGGQISDNSAQNNGGAIHAAKGSTVKIYGGTIRNNTAAKSGGAIAAVEAVLELTGGQIDQNTAGTYGGGIYANGATVTLDKATMSGNVCDDTGGAIAISNYTQLTVSGGTIAENKAKNAAAVCVMSNAHLILSGGALTKNTATGDGGAIYVSANGNLTLSGGAITENTAGNKGGGLYVTGSSKAITVTGAPQVQGNRAAEKTNNLQLGGGKILTVTAMTGGKVGITTDEAGLAISDRTEDFSAFFTADYSAYAVEYREERLYIDYASKHLHCLCGGQEQGCDHSQLRWTPWGDDETEKGKLPANSGSYYLTEDIVLSVAANVSTNDDIHICLNGHMVRVDYATEGKVEDQIFFMTRNGKLTISDCTAKTEDGVYTAGKLTGGSKAVISLNKLNDKATENTLVLYDGILTGNTNTTDGGAINITAGNGTFLMYGGEITGNTAQGMGGAIHAAKGSTVQICGGVIRNNTAVKNGGAVAALSAALTVTGGQITGNTGDNGAAFYLNDTKAQITGGTVSGNTAKTAGGAAAVSNGSVVEMAGGEVLGNTAPNGGGLCIMSNSQVTVSGGKFAENRVTANGGALYVSYNAGLTVSGGQICGNSAQVHGSAIFTDKDSQLSILGGTITENTSGTTGAVSIHGNITALKVGGKPVIENNKVGTVTENLRLRDNAVMQVLTLEEGAKIGITADSLPRFISEAVTGDPSAFFIPDNAYRTVTLKDSKLYMDYSGEHQHCFCAGDDKNCGHENVKWASWEATDALPTASGSYYLLSDVVLPNAATLRTGADVKLCLNGHTVTAAHEKELVENDRVYILRNDAKLTISDCTAKTENGKYTAGKLTGGTMAAVILHGNASATFDLYDGIITGNSRSDNVGGGVILRETTGKNVMNMYGGEISDNWAKGNGGGMYVKEGCTFNMYGGSIRNNKSTTFHGGGIAIVKNGTVNLYGGKVADNTASKNGGGIFVQEGTLNVCGGFVDGNTAGSNGGGISGITAKINISDVGSVSYNKAKAAAGAISISTKTQLQISGGCLDYNTAKDGGAVCVMSESVMTLTGGSIGYNKAEANAGGIYVSRTGVLNMTGGSVHHNSCPRNGGGVFLNNARFSFSGGDISYNKTETASGGILVGSNSLVEMTGGLVRGNESIRGAGCVVQGKATFNMRGGKFEGNIAEIEAGAFYISTNSFFTLYDGEICENEAAYRGGGLLANASFTIAGGKVRANKVTGNEEYKNPYAGGVVIIGESEKTLTMTGGEICDNYSAGTGGGMRINYMNTLQMSGGTFRNNRAEKTAGGLEIYGAAHITGGEFIENTAGTVGGGLRVVSTVHLDMENVRFEGNEAVTRGGAVYLAKGNWTTMKNCTFTGNVSGEQGSAIYSWDELLLDGCTITGNRSGKEGAVYLCSANYDGQSYILAVPKIAGDLVIDGNKGPCPGLYLEDGAVAAIGTGGLGENAKIRVYLQSGVLTNTLFGSYDYEGGGLEYLVTAGDRSEREYEIIETPVPEQPQETELPEETATEPVELPTDDQSSLYWGIGAIGAVIVAAAIAVVLVKKKSSGKKTGDGEN